MWQRQASTSRSADSAQLGLLALDITDGPEPTQRGSPCRHLTDSLSYSLQRLTSLTLSLGGLTFYMFLTICGDGVGVPWRPLKLLLDTKPSYGL